MSTALSTHPRPVTRLRDEPRARSLPASAILSVVLAGGEGKRLQPLTAACAKPAVPIGGRYRLIDFVLSNLVNSGLHRIQVLTQYMSDPLHGHIARAWQLSPLLDQFIDVVPAQQRTGKDWYKGSADAVFQSLDLVLAHAPELVCVFSGDHLCRMDVRAMIDAHLTRGAEATVAAIPVPIAEARRFGVLEVDPDGRVRSFVEKPESPAEMSGRPGWALASMGNYVFGASTLAGELHRDAHVESSHDFGRDILPALVSRGGLFAYDFESGEQLLGRRAYWRDVGTLEAYFDAHMDLLGADPRFPLEDPTWPVRTPGRALPPARFHGAPRIAESLVSEGCTVTDANLARTVLGPGARIGPWAQLDECVVLEGATIGPGARLRRVIVEAGADVPSGARIGEASRLTVIRRAA